MASRPKATSAKRAPRPASSARSSTVERDRPAGTREAIREIVRRYRETFERLGR